MDDAYVAIGRIVAGWSRQEMHCSVILSKAVGALQPGVTDAVVAGQSIGRVWEVLEAVMGCYSPDLDSALADFRSWKQDAGQLRAWRNGVAHICWGQADDAQPRGVMLFGKGKGALKGEVETLTVGIPELRGAADAMDAAWTPLQAVFVQVNQYMEQRAMAPE